MIIKTLGILDIIIAILFWIFMVFSIGSLSSIVFLLGLFLLAKGIVFITNFSFASILDIISSFIIIIGSFSNLPIILVVIVSLFLFQKGVFSLL